MSDSEEILDSIDVEYMLDYLAVDYRPTRGVSGPQCNVRECPACGDSRSKVYLNAETGRGNCFVCDARFNKWSFVHLVLGEPAKRETWKEIRKIAKDQGWRPRRKAVATEEETEVKLPASLPLPIEGKNLVYLEKRGVNAETAEYFHLRYCHLGFHTVMKDGEKVRQNFSERVIIPVHDVDGVLSTFQGRDITGKSKKKYLFATGIPGTGRFFYNAHNAVHARHVVMGEGAFDVIAIHLAISARSEYRHLAAIGSFGKHLSYGSPDGRDQMAELSRLIKRGLETVTIMWDGEHKALKAAVKAGLKMIGVGLRVNVALLPRDKDPAEVDGAEVRRCIDKATPLNRTAAIKLVAFSPYQ